MTRDLLTVLVAAVPLLPIVAGIAVVVCGRRISDRTATRIAVGGNVASLALLSAVGAIAAFSSGVSLPIVASWEWFAIPEGPPLVASIGVRLDALALVVLPSLFLAAALSLSEGERLLDDLRALRRFLGAGCALTGIGAGFVLSTGLVQALAFWTGIAVAAYVTAAVNADRTTTAVAARKILLVHLATDAFLVLAVLLCWFRVGNLDFASLTGAEPARDAVAGFLEQAVEAGDGAFGLAVVSSVAFGAFAAVVGRCGLFPLFGWLHDSSRLPTAVCGLQQAAVVVPCGVLLLVRVDSLAAQGDGLGDAVALLGGLTALLAGIVAISQMDPKQVLGFVTASVIGSVVVGLGVGTVSASAAATLLLISSMPLLAVLWIGLRRVEEGAPDRDVLLDAAGAISVATPVRLACLVAGFALVSGFLGQNAIVGELFGDDAAPEGLPPEGAPVSGVETTGTALLEGAPLAEASAHPSSAVVWLLLGGMLASSFACGRLYLLLFRGDERNASRERVVGESDVKAAFLPALVALVLIAAGIVGFGDWLREWLAPAFAHRPIGGGHGPLTWGLATWAAAIGLVASLTIHHRSSTLPARIATGLGPFTRLSRHRFYLDDFFFLFLALPIRGLAQLCRFVDWFAVDGLITGTPRRLLKAWDAGASPLRQAPVQVEALAVVLAAVAIAAALLWF